MVSIGTVNYHSNLMRGLQATELENSAETKRNYIPFETRPHGHNEMITQI